VSSPCCDQPPGVGRCRARTLLALGLLLGLSWHSVAVSQAAPPDAPQVPEAAEADLDFSDMLYVRNPLPSTSVEIGYRFERIRDRTAAGSEFTHKHEINVALSLAPTEWLGLSLDLPYQFLSVGPADGPRTAETNALGDLTAEAFVTLVQDPARRLAVAVGLDVGFPTGSVREGTGGQWTLTPFLNGGMMLGPIQIFADMNYAAELRALPDAGPRRQDLSANLGVGYPLGEFWIFPFLALNGVYTLAGPAEVRHRGQIALAPGVRIGPAAVAGNPGGNGSTSPTDSAKGAAGQAAPAEPWWKRLSVAIAPQFPLTATREFEWGITTAIKLDF